MIDIKKVIEEARKKENISDGNSSRFDFGDVVLVRYTHSLEYLRDSARERKI